MLFEEKNGAATVETGRPNNTTKSQSNTIHPNVKSACLRSSDWETYSDGHARALDALHSIPNDFSHDEWVRVIMAAKAADCTVEECDAWSAGAANYKGFRDVESVYNSVTPDGGISAGTLFHVAKQHGWTPDTSSRRFHRAALKAPRAERHLASPKAKRIWSEECEPATAAHPYVTKKRGIPDGLRVVRQDSRLTVAGRSVTGALAVPVYSTIGEIQSIQFILPDKKLNLSGAPMKGGMFPVGKMTPGSVAYVVEGIGQAWACYRAAELLAVVAFGAGNMRAVAEHLSREGFEVVLVPDVGKKEDAHAIASDLGCALVCMPDGEENNFDANDLALRSGYGALKELLENPEHPEPPPPLPLSAKVEPMEYPVDALPQVIRDAVLEVHRFVQSPASLIASSALSTLSLAVQPHVDVQRAEELTGPVSLYFLTIADSGERKTTVDKLFMQPIKQYESEQHAAASLEIKTHKAAREAWEAELEGYKAAIKQATRAGKGGDLERLKEVIQLHRQKEPKEPRLPKLTLGDATSESLAHDLAHRWPSAAMISTEGGLFFGGHSMKRENSKRTLGIYNLLWDGQPIDVDRRTSESFRVEGVRLTVGLQVQEPVLREAFENDGGLMRGSGFLARCLVAHPESTQGYRPFTEQDGWPALDAFRRRIRGILEQPLAHDPDYRLLPGMLSLSPDAKQAFIAFYNRIESELRNGGTYQDVRDCASKIAENAARIAALFQFFTHGGGAISLENFEAAMRIAEWHLNEARRFFGEIALPSDLANTVQLERWLVDYCRKNAVNSVSKNFIRQYGPGRLRNAALLEEAIEELAELNRAALVQEDRTCVIKINPEVLRTPE